LIFYEEHGHYFSIYFYLLVHPYYTSSYFIPVEVQKTNKNSPMKREYTTEQSSKNDEEGTTKSK